MFALRSIKLHAKCARQSVYLGSYQGRWLSTSNKLLAQLSSIKATPDEVSNGALNEHNLEEAVRCLYRDGIVVVENVIAPRTLDKLNTKMVADARYLQSLGKDGPFNYNQGNLQQDPPPTGEHFHSDIFLNPIAIQITSSILGPFPKWTFLSGNSAMPPPPKEAPEASSFKPSRQPVHSDADFAHPSHPFALVVNVPLVSMSAQNGSTEIWPGTHSRYDRTAHIQGDPRMSGRIPEDLLEAERERTGGPLQPDIPKGSLIVRDLRLWHAGMPNWSGNVRVMLAMIHFAAWYRNQMRIELGESCREAVEGAKDVLDVRADWIGDDKAMHRYLQRGFGNSYNFGQS